MADSTKQTKNYVKGSSKEVVFQSGDSVLNIDIKIEGKVLGSKGDILPNEAGYVKLKIARLAQPDQYGNTHAVFENDWKPDPNKKAPAKAPQSPPTAEFKGKKQMSTDDMPF